MGLLKLDGIMNVTMDMQRDYREGILPPLVPIHRPARAKFPVYALGLLGLTGLADADLVAQVRNAAEAIIKPADEPWDQFDAQTILKAVGSPPKPTHVLVNRVAGKSLWLMQAVQPDTPNAKRLIYTPGKSQPEISLLPQLRADGYTIPKGTCLEVPVKLAEQDGRLMLALLLLKSTSRAITAPDEEAK